MSKIVIPSVRSPLKKRVEDYDGLSELKRAAIFRVDSDGKIIKDYYRAVFLLNPTSFQENKKVNWVEHNIPGQSNPVMQWVSSGTRMVTFDALVTADTSQFPEDISQNISESPVGNTGGQSGGFPSFGEIAGKFFNVAKSLPRRTVDEKNADALNIDHKLKYYRSLTHPKYDNMESPRRLDGSPPLVVLYFGRSLLKKTFHTRITPNHDVWVVTGLNINVTKQRPDLSPLEAIVSFTLVQYNIQSSDYRLFLKQD